MSHICNACTNTLTQVPPSSHSRILNMNQVQQCKTRKLQTRLDSHWVSGRWDKSGSPVQIAKLFLLIFIEKALFVAFGHLRNKVGPFCSSSECPSLKLGIDRFFLFPLVPFLPLTSIEVLSITKLTWLLIYKQYQTKWNKENKKPKNYQNLK